MTISSFQGPYRFLSNFFPSPINWANREWPTVEHAYQAAKCTTQDEATAILNAPSPGIAKRIGNRTSLRSDWLEIRYYVMYELLLLKFAPGSALATHLLMTAPHVLIEGNSWGDRYWGMCNSTWQGENKLGILLMHIRNELQKQGLRSQTL